MLTDQTISAEWRKASSEDDSWMPQIHERFARAIEAAATAPLLERIAALEHLTETLKLEAQTHAQEARTANATIAEVYQLCSGGTGEPGNWHGAEPVRQKLSALEAHGKKMEQLAARGADGLVKASQTIAALEAKLAQRVPPCRVADRGFRWDGDRQEHIPKLVIEFDAVPFDAPADSKGWTDRDALAALLSAAPAAPEQQEPNGPIAYTPGEWFDATTVGLMQAFYEHRLPAIREAAKEHGYAIGLHGSMRRDLDLIAAPWRDGASDADTLAHAIAMAACWITRAGAYDWEQKPAGRVATCIPICWTHRHGVLSDGHIDLSVAPVAQAKPEQAAQPLTRTLTTRELADVTAPWSNVWTDQAFGIANAAITKFCEVNGIAAPQPKD